MNELETSALAAVAFSLALQLKLLNITHPYSRKPEARGVRPSPSGIVLSKRHEEI